MVLLDGGVSVPAVGVLGPGERCMGAGVAVRASVECWRLSWGVMVREFSPLGVDGGRF